MHISLRSLELDRVIELIALEAKSTLGHEALSRRAPGRTAAECDQAQGILFEMVQFYLTEGLLPFAGLTDIRALLSEENALDIEQAFLILRSIRATQAVRETFLRSPDHPRLQAFGGGIPDLGELVRNTGRYFTADGKLREEASAELRSIRTRLQAKRRVIQKTLNDLMTKKPDAIQDDIVTLRGERYCIPVRTDHRGDVPGILHERSGSGASLFIEPMGVIELNNDLADLLIQEREEIARIVRHIVGLLLAEMDAVLPAIELAGELDAIQACAIFFDLSKSSRPRFSSDQTLEIIDGRHPLLDDRLAAARAIAFGEAPGSAGVIPTTISLTPDRPALVVSGPNAGGKTVALKTAGLLVAMAMSGLPVPASDGTIIPVVDELHVLIGDDQNLLEHLSTFSAYLVRLKKVVERATPRSLVLLDELGSGTDPEEGAAIAGAVVQHLLDLGSLLIVTTHLSALKNFANSDLRIVNSSMDFDSLSGRPTYRLIAGLPGRSRAIEVAEIVGLPSAITESARRLLGDRYVEMDQLIADLQQRVRQADAERAALALERKDVETTSRSFQERSRQLEEERARLDKKYRAELDELKDQVRRNLESELKRLRDLDRAAREKEKPSSIIEQITRPLDVREKAFQQEREIRVGDSVEHRRLKLRGTVVSIDGTKVFLNVGGKRIQAELSDLALLEGKIQPPSKKLAPAPDSGGDLEPAVSAELNLIGQRVEEAIEETDKFLDRSLLQGKGAVRLIHGFGTGKLRKALREHLKKHPGVKSIRPGNEREGGDGATITLLDV